MKSTRYTNARRTQRQYERNKRVCAGAPYTWHDWQCHICHEWYSKYRGRNLIHLRCCERKEAKRIAREKVKIAQMVPLPSPERVPPFSTLDATPISRSPTAHEFSIAGDAGQEEDDLEDLDESLRVPVLDRALLGSDDESLGEFDILKGSVQVYSHH
jgi:hypothetical protein